MSRPPLQVVEGQGTPPESASSGGGGGGDGRLARLEARVNDVAERLARIEGQLTHMPTKEDIASIKSDLKHMPTTEGMYRIVGGVITTLIVLLAAGVTIYQFFSGG